MAQSPPPTQVMKISDVRSELNTLVNRVYRKETRVLVEKSGIPVAALVSTDDLKRLDGLDREQDRVARDIVAAMRAPFQNVPIAEIEQSAEQATAQVKAERRAERLNRAGT